VPEYLFSSPDTSETKTAMENAFPNMAPVCVKSTPVTTLQNVFPISAEPSLNTLNTVLHSNNSLQKIIAHRLFKVSPIPKIPGKYLIGKIATPFFLSVRNLVNSYNTSVLLGQKMQKKKSLNTRIHNQEASENVVSAGKTICEQLRKTTGSNV